ncbi:MAG: sugar phosphate isomerase/epimerase [Verrucomicrobiota bacterium]
MKIDQVAAILYTLRDHCKTPADVAATLKKVREIGYQAVQVSGICPMPEADLNAMLADNGLTCCATHEPALEIVDDTPKVIERLQTLNCTHTAYPHPAGVDPAKEADWDELIAKLAKAGEAMAGAGITLCYHNHGTEFVQFGGQTILERIYERVPANFLQGEPDTYWIQYGGGNPVDWMRKLKGRLPLLHLKDYCFTPEGKPLFCEIGNGTLDFPAIIREAEAGGCRWFIVEQDVCPGDPFDSLQTSFDYIAANLVEA